MTSEENLSIKASINTAWTGIKNAVRTFSLKLNSSSSLFGKDTSVTRSFQSMALG